MNTDTFKQDIIEGYQSQGATLTLGTAMLNGQAIDHTPITIPLKSLNRHGLIAGATGTGKTKTLQLFAELLSDQGVPTLLMDLKGDLSGLGHAGEENLRITERQQKIGVEFHPHAMPVEFLSISDEPGVRLRATVQQFGSILLSQILELNSTQRSVLAVVFKFANDNKVPLITLKDLLDTLKFISGPGADKFDNQYGHVSSSSIGSIQRKIIELQQQGADKFFGEPAFNVNELARTTSDGKGIVSVLRLTDLQSRPKLFSTFMLNLLTQVYNNFPEVGDLEKPKLIMVIDEAHLIFNNATKELVDKIETIIKLIRSKGVGIFFCTQNPRDIPNDVLSQLGLKIQHALRAFTAKDRKAIKLASENFPESDYYETSELLTQLGIGEALVSALNERGRPTPLAATLLQAPSTRMGPLNDNELQKIIASSNLVGRYEKLAATQTAADVLKTKQYTQPTVETKTAKRGRKKQPKTPLETFGENRLVRQLLNTFVRETTRAIMAALGIKKGGRRRK